MSDFTVFRRYRMGRGTTSFLAESDKAKEWVKLNVIGHTEGTHFIVQETDEALSMISQLEALSFEVIIR